MVGGTECGKGGGTGVGGGQPLCKHGLLLDVTSGSAAPPQLPFSISATAPNSPRATAWP